jgi:hypothetical protein
MEDNKINCTKIVEEYLLNKNPLYTFSFPLSLLIAIIMFGVAKARQWSENSYINQILIPILAFLGTMVLIDIISRMMISSEEKDYLIKKCKIWMHDPDVANDPVLSKIIDMNLVINYDENSAIENFSNANLEQNQDYDNIEQNQDYDNIEQNQDYDNFEQNQDYDNFEQNQDYDNFEQNQDYENFEGKSPKSSIMEEFTIQDNNIDNITKYNENLNDIMKVNEIVFQEQRKNYKEIVEYPISEIPNISPYPVKLEYPDDFERCVGGNTHDMNLCSGPDTQENPMHYPVPGPQWLPQSAETVQMRLAKNDYW